jgi:HD-GYP domain-containing protein (c-di-GMP phosphodiesterase class II)
VSERQVGQLLKDLRRLVHQVGLYPEGHPQTAEAVDLAARAVDAFLDEEEETVLTIHEDAFYRNRTVVPHASLEYRGKLRDLQQRGIESLTFTAPVSRSDLYDIATFAAGSSDDLPADGTIRLNEPYAIDPETDDTPASRLRGSYGATLDAMRFVTTAMVSRGSFELGSVVEAVEGMFENTMAHPGAALLLSTVKSHDEYTFFHSVNVGILSLAIGQVVGVEREILVPAAVGAVLHDIGKVAVSPAVLNYPGRLNEDQWHEITVHPQEGALAIMAAGGPGSEIAATVAFEHHARFDGQGYPAVTRTGRPHVYSRLVQVVDTYDAITARRAYRRAESPNRALEVLLDGAGSAWDPDFVRAFIRMMGVYPPGSIILTSSGLTGVVVAPAEEHGAPLPVVIVKDPSGIHLDEPEAATVPIEDVVAQILPKDADIDPAALLESATQQVAIS